VAAPQSKFESFKLSGGRMKPKPRQRRKPRYTEKQVNGLKARALNLWKADKSHAKELGLALLDVRAAMKYRHGNFKKWWTENKLSQARVSYCMRLALGKVADAKDRQRSAFQGSAGIVKEIKKDVNDFLGFVVKYNVDDWEKTDLSPVYENMVRLIGRMCIRFGELPGWTMNDPTALHTEIATNRFQKSLSNLFICLFTDENPLAIQDEHGNSLPEKKPAGAVRSATTVVNPTPVEQPATTKEEFAAFKIRSAKIRAKLETKGGLKDAGSLLREYILKESCKKHIEGISAAVWERILAQLESAKPAEVVKMVKQGGMEKKPAGAVPGKLAASAKA
jgi:hypothetical protein